jgi:hypothetical protein
MIADAIRRHSLSSRASSFRPRRVRLLGICATLAIRGLMVYNSGSAAQFLDLSISPGIFIASAVVTLSSGILSGVGPALFETRRLLGNPLRTLSRRTRCVNGGVTRWSRSRSP